MEFVDQEHLSGPNYTSLNGDEVAHKYTIRGRVHNFIEGKEQPQFLTAPWFYWMAKFALTAISIGCYVAQSETDYFVRPWSPESYRSYNALLYLELVAVSLQLLDFLARCFTSPRGIRYLKKPYVIMEIFYFICYYVFFILAQKFQSADDLIGVTSAAYEVIRVLTVTRVLTVIRLLRYFETTHLIAAALKRTSLAFSLLLILVSVLSLTFGSLMFFAEKNVEEFDNTKQRWVRMDGKLSPFQTIHGSMWWAITCLTTVGYGDAYPVSNWGKVIASIAAVTGILVLALPTGIVASTFSDIWKDYVQIRAERSRKHRLRTAESSRVNTRSANVLSQPLLDEDPRREKTRTYEPPIELESPSDVSSSSSEDISGILSSIRSHQREIDNLVSQLEKRSGRSKFT